MSHPWRAEGTDPGGDSGPRHMAPIHGGMEPSEPGARSPGIGRHWAAARTVLAWVAVVPVMGWLAVRVTGAGRGTRIETIIVLTPFLALASVLALAVAAALRVHAAILAAAGCCVGFGVVMAPVFVPDLLADGYVDAAGAVGDGWVITWRSGLAPPLTIDHVLVDRSTGVDDVSVVAVPGSDHRAVVADLRLPAD